MNFSRILFGSFSLNIYGIFAAVAFLAGSILFFRELKKRNFSTDFFLLHYWKWILFGLLIGRIFGVLLGLPDIIDRNGPLTFFAFWDGNIHFWGLGLGFIGSMVWFLRKKKVDYYRWLDAGIIQFLVGMMMLDIGQFLTGHIYGSETNLPWGIQYETFGVDILNPIHPVSIYAFFFHLWIYFWAQKYKNIWERFSGKLSIRAGLLFLCGHFFLQFFRGDSTVLIFNIMRIDQIFILAGIVFLFYAGHKNKTLKSKISRR